MTHSSLKKLAIPAGEIQCIAADAIFAVQRGLGRDGGTGLFGRNLAFATRTAVMAGLVVPAIHVES